MNIIFGIKRFVLQLSNFFAIPVWIVRCCTLQQRGGGDVRCEVERVLCRLKSGLAWTDWPALHKLLTIIRVLSPALPSSQQPHRGNRSAGLLHHISTRPGPVRHETKQAVRFSIGIHHYQVIKCISVSNINIWKPYESKKQNTIEIYWSLELWVHQLFCSVGDFPLHTFNFSGANLPLAVYCCC